MGNPLLAFWANAESAASHFVSSRLRHIAAPVVPCFMNEGNMTSYSATTSYSLRVVVGSPREGSGNLLDEYPTPRRLDAGNSLFVLYRSLGRGDNVKPDSLVTTAPDNALNGTRENRPAIKIVPDVVTSLSKGHRIHRRRPLQLHFQQIRIFDRPAGTTTFSTRPKYLPKSSCSCRRMQTALPAPMEARRT
jgi:hypothetical protein